MCVGLFIHNKMRTSVSYPIYVLLHAWTTDQGPCSAEQAATWLPHVALASMAELHRLFIVRLRRYEGILSGAERPSAGCERMLVLRQVLVVTPTADGNSVDVDYEVSDARLDVWAQRHGVPPVHTPFPRACTLADCPTALL